MVKINMISLPDGEAVYSYKIHDLGDKKVFDFVQEIYSSSNIWNKNNVLVDALVYRCGLEDVLNTLNCRQESLEWVLTHNFDDFVLLETALEEIEGCIRIGIGMAEMENYADKSNFFHRKKEEPVFAIVNSRNISKLFSCFDIFDENAVLKAYKLLCSGEYIKADNNFENIESDVEFVLSESFANGLVFGEEE